MKNINLFLRFFFLGAALTTGSAFAVNCGDTVSASVTLSSDLVCAGPGLFVGADDTTINLNGHTITCVGAGVEGSCQHPDGVALPFYRGILSLSKKRVKIVGPGTISGFAIGIDIHEGYGHFVQNVTVTGPGSAAAEAIRGLASGIQAGYWTCSASPTSPVVRSKIQGNNVSGQTAGITVHGSSCVDVEYNNAFDNNAAKGNAYGIELYAASKTNVRSNQVYWNGKALAGDAGIRLRFWMAQGNSVTSNQVNKNCGDGIVALEKASANTISGNVARYNGATTEAGCSVNPLSPFRDLRDIAAGPGNTWNASNVCRTQGGVVPVGVCNAGE